MDLSYSDSLTDFRGCFFNYQMNKYLSRGMDPDEYLKVYQETNPEEIRAHLNNRHDFAKPRQALLVYRDFCKEAYLTEKEIRDFFKLCLWYVKWCVTNLQPENNPFPHTLVQEILEDLAGIVYRKDSESKIEEVMREAHDRLQDQFTPGTSYLVCEELFDRVIADWNIEHDYAGDDHGQRLKAIFCASSIGHQKCANVAIMRGFQAYSVSLPRDEMYPRARPESSDFPRVNCYILFVNNPLNTSQLEAVFVATSKVVAVRSRGDFFKDFPASLPMEISRDEGAIKEQRVALLIALAAGKNFLHNNPAANILVPTVSEVNPFTSEVHGWVDNMVGRAFAKEVNWHGATFVHGQSRPGLYFDARSLASLLDDEETLMATGDPEEDYRKSIIAMAPKKLRSVTVPGEVVTIGGKRKRKRVVDTGEQGNAVRKPFETEVHKDVDPKHETDNSTIGYAILGIGTFLGVLFLSNKA